MVMTDPIADFLTRIRNANQANHSGLYFGNSPVSVSYRLVSNKGNTLLSQIQMFANIRVAIAGAGGRMGRQLIQAALALEGVQLGVGKIDIVKISGNRCTLSIKFEVGRLYGVVFHVSYSSYRRWYCGWRTNFQFVRCLAG